MHLPLVSSGGCGCGRSCRCRCSSSWRCVAAAGGGGAVDGVDGGVHWVGMLVVNLPRFVDLLLLVGMGHPLLHLLLVVAGCVGLHLVAGHGQRGEDGGEVRR